MAVAEVQTKIGAYAASATHTVTAAAPLTNGSLMLAFIGNYYSDTANYDWAITVPAAGYTNQARTTGAWHNQAEIWSDTFTTGDGDTVTAVRNDATYGRGGQIAIIEVSGSSAVEQAAASNAYAVSALTITAAGSATVDASRVYAFWSRACTTEAVGTPVYSNTFTELAKFQINGGQNEIYIAYKDYDVADGTPACELSGMASDQDMSAAIIIVNPATGAAPVVTTIGPKVSTVGVAESYNVVISDPNSDITSFRLRCTSGNGTWGVTLATGCTVTAGANNSADMTVGSGTHANLITTMDSATMTSILQGADAACRVDVFDAGARTDFEIFTNTAYYMTVVASTQALLNTALATLTATNANVATETLTVLVTDDQAIPATGSDSASVVTGLQAVDFMDRGPLRRRRRQKDKTWWRQEQ